MYQKTQTNVGNNQRYVPIFGKKFQKIPAEVCSKLNWTDFKATIQNKLASSKQRQKVAIRNYDSLTDSLTGVKCRATSVAKNTITLNGKK